MRLRSRLVIALIGAATTGCSSGVFLQHNPLSERLDATIVAGATTRAEARELLGDRLEGVDSWAVDVFFAEGTMTDLLVGAIPHTRPQTYFALVSYDQADRVSAMDSGGAVYRTYLESDGFRFNMSAAALFAPARESARLAELPIDETNCTAVIWLSGIPVWTWPAVVSDAGYRFAPFRDADDAYARWALPPGTREIVFEARSFARVSRALECRAGQMIYIRVVNRDGAAELSIAEAPTAELADRRLQIRPN